MQALTHGQERNLFAAFIADNTGGVRIKHWLAIYQKTVLMMAVTELHLSQPPAVHRPLHGQWMPMVKISCQLNRFGVGRGTEKTDRLVRIFGGIPPVIGITLCQVHKKYFFVVCFFPAVTCFHFSILVRRDSLTLMKGSG